MVIKTAICDDMLSVRQQINDFLSQIERESGDTFEIQEFSSGEELEKGMGKDTQLLLLDIMMGGENGIQAARKLREEKWENLVIIFITSASEYAVEGYTVRAFGFLEKPLRYPVFRREIQEAISQVIRKNGVFLTLVNGKSKEVLRSNEIIYVEVYGHTLHIATTTGHRKYTIPLADVEATVCNAGFFRCHKSYLINFLHIQNILPGEVEMSNGDRIPVSKHRQKNMLNAFAAYMGNFLTHDF